MLPDKETTREAAEIAVNHLRMGEALPEVKKIVVACQHCGLKKVCQHCGLSALPVAAS